MTQLQPKKMCTTANESTTNFLSIFNYVKVSVGKNFKSMELCEYS